MAGLLPDEALAGFRFLSSLGSGSVAEGEAALLTDKLRFIPEHLRDWFNYYLEYYGLYGLFCPWGTFKDRAGLESDPALTETECAAIYHRALAVWESDNLIARLAAAPFGERAAILQKLSIVAGSESAEAAGSPGSLSGFQLEGSIITDTSNEKRYFSMPTRHLNSVLIINPGTMLSIIASPGNFKTQFALNMAYLNSVSGSLNTLYIYLENVERSYQIELLARHSYSSGARIENSRLKRGIFPTDTQAAASLKALQADLQKNKGGEVYFQPFSRFHPDPLRFAGQLSAFINRYNIHFVVFDYVQAAVSFMSASWEGREYMNRLVSVIRQVSLGAFGAPPVVSLVLAQPKKEAEERQLASKGQKLTLFDASEAASIERDSFIVLGLYADAVLKSQGNLLYKVLKNRDEAVDIGTTQTSVFPQYCFIGDQVLDSDSLTYTKSDMDDLFSV